MKRAHKLILIFVAVVLVLLKVSVLDQYLLKLLRKPKCSDDHIVTVIDSGQLGNIIWEYMSLFAVTHLYKDRFRLVAYCPEQLKAKVEYVFERKKLYSLKLNETLDLNELANSSRSLVLGEWSARYAEVLQYGFHNIKKELRFRKRYIDYCYRIFDKILTAFGLYPKSVTFVGMHYRGTDYVELLQRHYNNSFNSPPDYWYYLRAMHYFKRRYKTVIFILITIDFVWLEENLPFLKENNNLVVNPNQEDPVKDLALLSHCNHSILNYGTFGVTAALFAGGTTFAYDLGVPLDHRGPTVAMGITQVLPNWYVLKGP